MAGTLTVTGQNFTNGKDVVLKKLAWVTTSGGAFSSTFTVPGGVLLKVTFVPDGSTTQPTDAYDVVLNDPRGIDVLGGLGANLSNATATSVVPTVGSSGLPFALESGATMTLTITNAGNSKGGTIYLHIR